jgi:N,N-dimethylformamidase
MLKMTGYSDRIYCRPGDTIKFMVNCEHPTYQAEMVRIICGDDNPNGPGVKEDSIDVPFAKTYPGRRQEIHSGSCVVVPNCAAAAGLQDFTIQTHIWPTTPLKGRQGIITKWSAQEKSGFALIVDEHGHIALQVGDGTGNVDISSTGRALQRRRWYLVGAAFDAKARRIRVFQQALAPVPDIEDSGSLEVCGIATLPPANRAPLVFAAFGGDGSARFQEHFNGKIDSPRIGSRALDDAESAEFAGSDFRRLASDVLGAWDFSVDMSSQTAFDRGPNRLHGQIVNFPTRAMTGWNWNGEYMDWRQHPGQMGSDSFP